MNLNVNEAESQQFLKNFLDRLPDEIIETILMQMNFSQIFFVCDSPQINFSCGENFWEKKVVQIFGNGAYQFRRKYPEYSQTWEDTARRIYLKERECANCRRTTLDPVECARCVERSGYYEPLCETCIFQDDYYDDVCGECHGYLLENE